MRAILLVTGILGGVMPIFADPPTTTPPTYDETIIVTSSLEEQDEKDTTASVTVIGRAEIEERQATTVEELLRTVPGITVVRSGSPGKATSVFTRGTESDHTLVLWNGVELNDPYFGGFDWAFLPTEGVERVEVVRGPASTLYGSDAIGGVVQILTRSAPGTEARFEGGGDSYLRGSVSSGWQAGPVRLDVAGHVRRGDGRLDNDFFDGEELVVRADWTASEHTTIGVVARANNSEIGVPYNFFGTPSPNRRQELRSTQIAVPVTWQTGPWRVESQLSTTTTDLTFRDPDDPFATSDTDATRDGARLVGSYHFREDLWVALGADWDREEVTATTAFGPALDDVSQETWSSFGELFWTVGVVTFDLGLRHDDNDAFGAETTLRAASAVDLGERVRLRASYGEGFRAPSLGDLYYPGFGNPDLQPETSESVEAAIDWTLGSAGSAVGSWGLSLAGYSTDLENLIVFDFVRSLPFNVGKARSRGVELELDWSGAALPGHPAGRLSVAYQDPEDLTTGEQLLRRPERSASLLLAGRPTASTSVNLVVDHVGERPDVGGVVLDRYTTVQLGGSWRWTERLEPYLRVENLLDEEYEEAAGFPSLGRRLIGGLHVRF